MSRYNVTGEWSGRALTLTITIEAVDEADAKAKFAAMPMVGADMYSRAESVNAYLAFDQARTILDDDDLAKASVETGK